MGKLVRVLLGMILVLGGSLSAHAQLVPNLGGQRAGISGFQSLKIGVGARGVGMGESYVAVANDASALFWNPAGLAQFEDNQVFFSHTQYLVDISHDFLGAVYHLSPADVLGASVSSMHMDDMEITTETQPFGTGRYFTFGDVTLALTFAKKMTDQFSFGVTARYAEETLDVLKMRALMFDLGAFYWTGLGSTRFAVVISNFGGDATPSGSVTMWDGTTTSSFQTFSVPTIFKLGFAFEAFETEMQRLTASIQLNHPNDNSEHVRFGFEYGFQQALFLRGGLKRTIRQPLFGEDGTSDENYSLGAGFVAPVASSKVSADYSYTEYYRLGSIHRFTLTVSY